MIEIDWDKIRENTLKLVCGYRDTYAGKEWKCRELQEKNGQIRTEIERIFIEYKVQILNYLGFKEKYRMIYYQIILQIG